MSPIFNNHFWDIFFKNLDCHWNGLSIKLAIHYDQGFFLIENANGHDESNETVLRHYPFDKLKSSSDDGQQVLYLEFVGENQVIELDLSTNPKPLVFIIHNYLSAKLHRLGLII